MSGIYDLSRSMRPKCPECGSILDVGALGNELFRKILRELMSGKSVRVDRFGVIDTYVAKAGKRVHTVYGEYKKRRPFVFVRLRMSKFAKRKLNEALLADYYNNILADENNDEQEEDYGEQDNQHSNRESELSI